jgi:hypothetical protein
VKERQETDSIDIIDDIRYILVNKILFWVKKFNGSYMYQTWQVLMYTSEV